MFPELAENQQVATILITLDRNQERHQQISQITQELVEDLWAEITQEVVEGLDHN